MGVKILFFSLLVVLVILISGCEDWDVKDPLLAPISCKTYEGAPAQCVVTIIGEDPVCPPGYYYERSRTCSSPKGPTGVSEVQAPRLSPGGNTVKVCCMPKQCANWLDDNNDGEVDGYDDGCIRPEDDPHYPELYDPEDWTETLDCGNGDDDDFDGLIDDEDPGCYVWSAWENDYVYQPTRNSEKGGRYKCDNGIDDDGNGKIDYEEDEYGTPIGDTGCQSPFDNNEADTLGCIDPEEIIFGSFISTNLDLCPNEIYDWSNMGSSLWGLNIVGDDLIIDCHGAKIIGSKVFDRNDAFPYVLPVTGAFRGSYSNNVHIRNCKIEGFDGAILFSRVSDWTISDNEFKNNALGVTSYKQFDPNKRSFNGYGNLFIENSDTGILINQYSGNVDNEIYQNSFVNNEYAIKLAGLNDVSRTINNYVHDNYIMGNYRGISLEYTEDNVIEGNNLLSLDYQSPFVCLNDNSNSGINFCEDVPENICGGVTCEFNESEDENTLLLLHFDNSLIGEGGEEPLGEPIVNGYRPHSYGTGVDIQLGNNLTYSRVGNFNISRGTIEFVFSPDWDGTTEDKYMFFKHGLTDSITIGKFFGDGPGSPHEARSYLYFNAKYGAGLNEFIETNTFFDEPIYVGNWLAGSVHHIKVTWDKDVPFMRLYIDGNLVDEKKSFSRWPINLGDIMYIGMYEDGKEVKGIIDEFRISDIAR